MTVCTSRKCDRHAHKSPVDTKSNYAKERKMANVEFGTGKSVFILAIVAGCFAILWPRIFYPMLTGPEPVKRPVDISGGCCDVLFETDVDAIRVLSEMCSRVNGVPSGAAVTPAGVTACRNAVMQACDIDIATFLSEQARLGRSYRQILDGLRSFNTSTCLRRNFGVTPGSLGAPRSMRTWGPTTSRHLRQERPPHLRPEGVHPALRERGRAIPASHIVPRADVERDAAPRPPIPGMRPPMGGAGHVVPPPKTGGNTMSVVMPLYTIGIVIFFMYTIMKVFVRKSTGEDDGLRDFQPDPEFRRVVFADGYDSKASEFVKTKEPSPRLLKSNEPDPTRLGWKERDTRDDEIDQLRRRLEETEKAMERIVAQMGRVPRVAEATLRKITKPEVSPNGPKKRFCRRQGLLKAKRHLSNPILAAIGGLLAEVDRHLELTPGQYSADSQVQQPEEAASQEEIAEKPTEQVNAPIPFEIAVEEPSQEELSKEEQRETSVEGHLETDQEENQIELEEIPRVQVLGVETRARAEGGIEWHPPPSPTLGLPHSRPTTPIPPSVEPHNIFLEGTLPSNSQILVEDATELLDDSKQAIILSGKMTLSLISIDKGNMEKGLLVEPVQISDEGSTLFDVETAVIDDVSVDGEEQEDPEIELHEEQTHFTTANTAGNPSVANAVNSAGKQEAEADDTAADVSVQDLLDDQEDLQEEYDALWGALEMEENGEEVEENESAAGKQHQR